MSDIEGGSEYVTLDQAMRISEHVAVTSTRETLQTLGMDVSSPEAVIQLQVDMAHLRRHRTASESAVKQVKKSAIAVVTVGFLGALWVGVQEIIKAKTGG